MAGGGDDHANQADDAKDSDSDGEGAEEILEESPCRRWSKRREKVKQRDVPGIDAAYLAMDNETGNEVVWNEVLFSERKNFRAQEEKINATFTNLTTLVHTNLVKFHHFWSDVKSEKPRIIFITEFMPSGTMAVFLQRTRKGSKNVTTKFESWKKWTTQILSALNYLHSSKPPIVHGNLSCNTIFIQQNGLIKIGCVAPDAINHHVKTCREGLKSLYYMAPETELADGTLTPAADIYAFGVCALEIALVGGPWADGTEKGPINNEYLMKCVGTLEDGLQRQFLTLCLNKDPTKRPSARALLFHPCLFEVHSLKLLSAYAVAESKLYDDVPDATFRVPDNEKVAASSKFKDIAYCQVSSFQPDLEKFIEEVRGGIYPLTAFAPLAHEPMKSMQSGFVSSQPSTSDGGSSDKKNQPNLSLSSNQFRQSEPDPSPSPPAIPQEDSHKENRTIKVMKVSTIGNELTIWLLLEDDMNRQLTTEISEGDSPQSLVQGLVLHGFISEADSSRVERELMGVLTPPT